MRFEPTTVTGAMLGKLEPASDSRGFFARLYSGEELERHGLSLEIKQSSLSSNAKSGTLRGMHYQVAPFEEAKLVTCIRGAIFDVVLDLRPSSPTYTKWFGGTLGGAGFDSLFIPQGCAHGFLTLEDESVVLYQISESYRPTASRGVRFDDPAFAIEWPFAPSVISERDLAFGPFEEARR